MSTGTAKPDAPAPSPVPDLVAVLAQFIARPGRDAQVRDGLLRVADGARGERGNLDYDLYQRDDQPWAFYVLANWAEQAAAEAHVGSAHVRDFLEVHGTDLAAASTRFMARMLSLPDPDADRSRPVPDSDQVVFFPFFSVKPGQVDTVVRALAGAVDPTRAEDGCLDYDLYQSFDDPTVIFFREHWTGRPALDRHMNTADFHKIVRSGVDPRLSVPWTGLAMTMVSPPGPIRTPVTARARARM
jgi:quinol monooxygenase YgiN